MDEEVTVKARQELEMRDLCRSILDSSPMPMVCVEGTGHIIRFVNPAFCDLAGKPKEDLVGNAFSAAATAGEESLAMLDRVYRTGQSETHMGGEPSACHPLYWSYVMWQVLAADGGRAGIIMQVAETTSFHKQTIAMNQALVLASVRQHELTEAAEALNEQLQEEIIQRKLAEEEMASQRREIEASERRYRGLIEAIPQIVWTATPQGTLDFANSKWFEHLGIELDAFNQAGWPVLLHPDDKDRSLEAWSNGLKSESAFQIEHRLRNISSSSFRWYLSRAVPIGTEGGPVVKWFGTSTDVEDQKRAQMAVFSKQKLESVGLLAGGIAHDFNNLLVGVVGNASLAQGMLPPGNPAAELLDAVVHAGEQAAHLTRQMLAYAGKGRFLLEPLNLSDLIPEMIGLVQPSVSKKIALHLELESDLPSIQADHGQMQQVLMNLVLNAAEAIGSDAGLISVKTGVQDMDELYIRHHLQGAELRPGKYLYLEVRDTGCGMEETTKAKIFDPFFSTKFKGRGLGLAAVSGIVRGHNGAITVSSTPGKGSSFTVLFPAAEGAASVSPVAARGATLHGTGTILVVDDEKVVREMVKKALERYGYKVLVADSGLAAIDVFKRHPGDISLVVLDLSMPGMSGEEALPELRKIRPNVKVVVSSGYSEAEMMRLFAGQRVSGFLQKPFTFTLLAEKVKECAIAVEEWRIGESLIKGFGA